MTTPRRNRYKRNRGGSTYAALGIIALVLLVAGGYFMFAPRLNQPEAPPSTPPTVFHAPLPERQETPAQVSPLQKDGGLYPEAPVPGPGRKTPLTSGGPGSGRLAVIIDDMGTSMHEARALADIGVPLTFAIIPGLRSYRAVAAYAAEQNTIETMIHIPMQPKEWPGRRLEANGLLVSMSDSEIRERLDRFVRDIPGAVGANNHMGSEFTEHDDKMQPVLEVLKGKGLFFIDSVTTSKSAGLRLSRGMGVRSGRRHVFLDNEQNDQYITGQLYQAVRLAKKNGEAIAICHPHQATIRTLASVLPGLERQGIILVPASQLAR